MAPSGQAGTPTRNPAAVPANMLQQWSPSSQGQNSSVTSAPSDNVQARFIDALANQFGFGDQEQDLRQNLHGFAKLGSGLEKADLATRAYLVASVFSLIKENRAMTAAHRGTQTLLADLQIRLDATFSLSTEQKANIRIVTCDVIFDPTRVTFMQMHFDVITKLREDAKSCKLTNVMDSPSREKILASVTKRISSSVRNSFREAIRDSVMGEDTLTLVDFAYNSAAKFKRTGGSSELGPAYTSRLAILRRFAYEHPDLLDRVEDTEDPSPDEGATAASTTSAEPPTKKRKLGRTPKGEDFWSQVDQWFEARKLQWGNSWGTPGWKAYILETVQKDEQKYLPHVVQNPFMADVEVADIFNSNASGTANTTHTYGQLGGMEDILNSFNYNPPQ
ncbi:hypothetical protein FIBSPDRAFT_854555 [Athelia psychrophila]|uniref:Uncharacterized protein n=1 Tax=Athelia psychrophila TaxID=1759441 RepID=A0A166Q7L6_9AGAM|nr:hypothetical protein FIBSPDRAFT_854555 [Fibularhizoctonia sp. CBS 109695]